MWQLNFFYYKISCIELSMKFSPRNLLFLPSRFTTISMIPSTQNKTGHYVAIMMYLDTQDFFNKSTTLDPGLMLALTIPQGHTTITAKVFVYQCLLLCDFSWSDAYIHSCIRIARWCTYIFQSENPN
jgi:hypothetical protein